MGEGGQGALTVSSGGAVFASQVYNEQQGTLAGDGTINATVFNGGKVAPNGTLRVFGTYAQLPAGKLDLQIYEADFFDKLAVTGGTLILSGELKVSVAFSLPPFQPQIGQTFDILDWPTNQISGTFDSVDLPPLPSSMKWNDSQL